MRLTALFLPAVLAPLVNAQPNDAKLFSLIPPDARVVYGIDIARHQQSELRYLYPIAVGEWLQHACKLVVVEFPRTSGRGKLTILSGSAGSLVSSANQNPEAADGLGFALLDGVTAAFGDPDTVRDLVSQWGKEDHCELAGEAKRLSETYDNWFLAVRPFQNLSEAEQPGANRKHRANFAETVEEVRGGIRFGRDSEVRVEVTMKTADDAMALVALSRWLPGLVQAENPASRESDLAELMENLTVMPAGKVVMLSFTLDESKLSKLRCAEREGQPVSEGCVP